MTGSIFKYLFVSRRTRVDPHLVRRGFHCDGHSRGKGLYQRKDGRYEARTKINGSDVSIYGFNLRELKKEFQEVKKEAQNSIDFRRKHITLNEWFEECFQTYKLPVVKETSVYPMKNKFYGSFGKYLGERKLCDITNIDIQSVINQRNSDGRAVSSMREALGRMRECMEAARNNQILSINPCFEISVPWENRQVSRRFLSREEQNTFLKTVEHSWYKEMFYLMFLTGMRIGWAPALQHNHRYLYPCVGEQVSGRDWKVWKGCGAGRSGK